MSIIHKLNVMPITLLFTLSLLQWNMVTPTDWNWPPWLGEDIRGNLSTICDPSHQQDLSNIDRKLGCDCIFQPPLATADCSRQGLGLNKSLTPARLNVSLHVKNLNFADNYFTKLDEDTFDDVSGIFVLDFSRNRIETVGNLNFTRLLKIDLSFNLIGNLSESTFKKCLQLQEINLSFNSLKFIEPNAFNQLRLLKKLNLASNAIGDGVDYYDEYEFKLENMEFLREVDLSNNSLFDFPTSTFNGTNHVKILKLRKNFVTFVPFDAFDFLPDLEELDLSENPISMLGPNSFHGFYNLKILSLNGLVDLERIDRYAFSGLRNLNDISCEKNSKLSQIDVQAFRGDPEMEDSADANPKLVKLADNSLSYIDFGLLNWTTLEELILDRNPWMCDCNLQWVSKFNNHTPKDSTVLKDFRCYGPAPLKGVNVVDVDPNEMLCFSPTVTIAGALGVLLFCVLLVIFCSLFAMKTLGALPEYFNKFQIFGNRNSLPNYTPLPKPGVISRNIGNEETPPDLEWDSTDLPPVYR